jgi:hypothetical protein
MKHKWTLTIYKATQPGYNNFYQSQLDITYCAICGIFYNEARDIMLQKLKNRKEKTHRRGVSRRKEEKNKINNYVKCLTNDEKIVKDIIE